ncbi:MAG TPA: M14 family zinc carboxypeptidase [Longimicrobiales bacterium]|nr:M14 family zinc carboxypeptidase [Longimicrobiales bacterium]
MLTPLAFALLLQVPPTPELAPGTQYDPAIPTLEQVAGHAITEALTWPEQIVSYFQALAAAAPERTRLLDLGKSWQGRAMVMLVIGSPERMARLDRVKADLKRLADPRGLDPAEAERLVRELPVVSAMIHNVHGSELSGGGAALAEAYHLLAARGDATVDLILRESLVLIDPLQNPDGRARFLFQNQLGAARWPDADPLAAERDEPWPGGRGNHYLFDLNRDWFAQTQPETQGRVAALLGFMPHIVSDLHEMGGNSTYYFPPNAVPGNTWTTDEQRALSELLGQAMAGEFDARGFAYFNRDTYDAFYPGYGVSWPMAQGAIGATYEMASARGLVYRRSDGDLLTYGDGILRHFTAALATLRAAAENRERILRTFLEFRRSAVAMGRTGPREYVLHSSHDPGMAARLAETLVANGIEVSRATGPVQVGDRTLPARGTYVVPMDQPAHRLVRNLLDRHTPMDEDFVAEQVERRANRVRDQIYDVTAWSLPLLWDVELLLALRPTGASVEPMRGTRALRDAMSLPEAEVGYLIPWSSNGAAAVAEVLRSGIRVRTSGGKFVLQGRSFGVGTALVRTSENDANLARRLAAIAAKHGAEIVPVDDSYVREGTSLGSGGNRALREPRVLLVWDQPGSSTSAGWARYVLERRYGQRVSAVRAAALGRAVLTDYDVIVFPSGSYGSAVGQPMVERLQAWMRDGGTVVTMAESTAWASRAGLLATKAERRGGRAEGTPAPAKKTPEQPVDYLDAIAPADEAPEETPGAILRVLLDTDHWLSAGTDGDIGAMVEGSRIFSPITLDAGTNVGRYADEDGLVLSGIVWDDAQPQLANKAFLIHQPVGRGQLVAFAEDPTYRAYAETTELLFMNAVLLGPGR